MRAEAPGGGHAVRPPASKAVDTTGASLRRTARTRPVVPVELKEVRTGYRASDRYIRRFWVAAIGSGAVAELLRLVRAAEKGESVRLPRYLPVLLTAGLVEATSGSLRVPSLLPVVPPELRYRFTPTIANEHARIVGSASHGQNGHEG